MRSWVLLVGIAIFSCSSPSAHEGAATERAASTEVPPPLIGPELGMDDPVLATGAPSGTDPFTPTSEQLPIAVDASGTSLLVWSNWNSYLGYVYGARVSQAGDLLDPFGFPIMVGDRRFCTHVAVAANGGTWLVVARDEDAGTVVARRVRSDGTVLDSTDIVIGVNSSSNVTGPAVAPSGEGFWVTWAGAGSSGGTAVFGARVGTDGNVLDPGGSVLASPSGSGTDISLAAGATNALLTWYDDTLGLRATRLSPEGAVLDPAGIAVSGPGAIAFDLQVANDGTDWLVGWGAGGNPNLSIPNTIYLRRVGSDGAVLGTTPLALSAPPNLCCLKAMHLKGLASVGQNWGLTYWAYGSGTYMFTDSVRPDAAASSGLAEAAPTGWTPLVPPILSWSMAYNGEQLVIPYSEGPEFGFATTVSEHQVVKPFPNAQTLPSAAYNGTNFLVAWQDDRNASDHSPTEPTVYATRVTPSGAALDTSGLALLNATHARVASAGQDWLVVGQSGNGVVGRRVDALGQLLDADAIVIDSGESPEVGFDGENWLVVYSSVGLRATRVSRAGDVLDPVQLTPDDVASYALTFDGRNALIGWTSSEGINVARLSRTGEVLGRTPIAVSLQRADAPLALAYGTAGLFVVWSDGTGPITVRGARVAPDGGLLDPGGVTIATMPSSAGTPAVTRYGADWLVSWTDGTEGVLPTPPTVREAIVPASGAFNVTSLAVPSTILTTMSPALARGAGSVLLAYQEEDPVSVRVKARMLEYPCDGLTDPLCAWTSGGGGFGNAFDPPSANGGDGGAGTGESAGLGGEAPGNAGSTSAAGGHPGSGGTSHAGGATHAGAGGDTSSSGEGGVDASGGRGTNGGGSGRARGGAGGAAHAGHAGSSAQSGGMTGTLPPASSEGCGCRVGGGSSREPRPSLLLLGAAALLVARRRSQRASMARG